VKKPSERSGANFGGARVLALESRRGPEIATLISRLGGEPILAPALREVPLESNLEAVRFAGALIEGAFDIVIFLTGVGARALLAAVEHEHPRDRLLPALSKTRVAVRGPKPLAVMREWLVPVWLVAPEPNTWRELTAELDARAHEQSLNAARIAVQEYGVSNPELLAALSARGAIVTRVPVYQWTLPDDLAPLKAAATALAHGQVDVIVLTSGIQLVHLWQIVEELGLADDVRPSLSQTVIASIGPTTTEEIRRRGLAPDLEASHPKMGVLVTEAAAQSAEILRVKRA
jgi:uroporphyrinogen-III synthase